MNLKDTFKIFGIFSDSLGFFQNLSGMLKTCSIGSKSLGSPMNLQAMLEIFWIFLESSGYSFCTICRLLFGS